jgi:hypothetical protein
MREARRTLDDSAPFAAPGTDSKSAGDDIHAPAELHIKPQALKNEADCYHGKNCNRDEP